MKSFAVASLIALSLTATPAAGLGSLRHLNVLRSHSLQTEAADKHESLLNRTMMVGADHDDPGQGGIPQIGAPDPTKITKEAKWTKENAGIASYVFACIWCTLIAMMPMGLHFAEHGVTHQGITKTQIAETVVLYVWLICGLYLFTNVLLFQSPHFGGEIRSLSLEEAVYLFSQIITTVGYGDITPAKTRGQVFVGLFVVFSFLLVAGMISQFANLVLEGVQERIVSKETPRGTAKTLEEQRKEAIWTAATPLMQSGCVFSFFLLVGVVFFSQYPGENKTVFQAIYMSFITLSSVGFGAFTPVTHVGMVFGAFWMLFGVSSLGAVISSTGAFVAAIKHWEKEHPESAEEKA